MKVKELIAQLQAMPEDAPVFVGTGYDNDTALTRTFGVEYTPVRQIDGPFFDWGEWGDDHVRGVVIA